MLVIVSLGFTLMLHTSKILEHSENNNLKVHEHKYNLNVHVSSSLNEIHKF